MHNAVVKISADGTFRDRKRSGRPRKTTPWVDRLMRRRAFAHGAMGHRIDPSWGGPIELFLVPASAPRLV